ncbi:MAG: 23S rRNA (pseudouridine(1915)-N(3))-methyltransferase RlmH [Peptococcaceae bacterium]|nr:23S rRNA (pseudouridine(1915)-N(3))-methyltransferase RlmH [Peptococcaceae bacterium]
MHLHILAVGRIKERYLVDGIREYQRRLRPYARVNVTEVADCPFSPWPSAQERQNVLAAEAAALQKHLSGGTRLVAFDRRGRAVSSEEFAALLADAALYGQSHVTFLIGGALGLDPSLLRAADDVLSFSRLTFPHQMFRLILFEQVYRACKINKREPYHW